MRRPPAGDCPPWNGNPCLRELNGQALAKAAALSALSLLAEVEATWEAALQPSANNRPSSESLRLIRGSCLDFTPWPGRYQRRLGRRPQARQCFLVEARRPMIVAQGRQTNSPHRAPSAARCRDPECAGNTQPSFHRHRSHLSRGHPKESLEPWPDPVCQRARSSPRACYAPQSCRLAVEVSGEAVLRTSKSNQPQRGPLGEQERPGRLQASHRQGSSRPGRTHPNHTCLGRAQDQFRRLARK
jgi:hypothetical protein